MSAVSTIITNGKAVPPLGASCKRPQAVRRLAGSRGLSRRLLEGGGRGLQRLDPAHWRAVRLFADRPQGDTLLLCVYRAKNAGFVTPLIHDCERLGAEIRLWALDSVDPDLRAWTCGEGPGLRMELLNRLWAGARAQAWDRVVVSDDDFQITRGDLGALLTACLRCGFGIAQPAHAVGSCYGRRFPRSRPLTVARLTSWVDVGPVVVIGRDWIDRVLPFPAGAGMGWGLGLVWGQLREAGCRLGIVDSICVRHLFPPALEYDTGPEDRRVTELLAGLGLGRTREAQTCLDRWMFWQARPPWQGDA